MINTKAIFLLAGLLPLAIMGKANTGKPDIPLVHGYVTDAITKKPVSGVMVSAMLPGANCLKEVLTDADGYFHFSQLPATQVNLQFDKKGYQSYKRSSVPIKEKLTAKVNVEFLPEDGENEEEDSENHLLRMLQIN